MSKRLRKKPCSAGLRQTRPSRYSENRSLSTSKRVQFAKTSEITEYGATIPPCIGSTFVPRKYYYARTPVEYTPIRPTEVIRPFTYPWDLNSILTLRHIYKGSSEQPHGFIYHTYALHISHIHTYINPTKWTTSRP